MATISPVALVAVLNLIALIEVTVVRALMAKRSVMTQMAI